MVMTSHPDSTSPPEALIDDGGSVQQPAVGVDHRRNGGNRLLHTRRLGRTGRWNVTVTGRNQRSGEQAVASLRKRAGHDDVTFLPVDHSIVEQNTSC